MNDCGAKTPLSAAHAFMRPHSSLCFINLTAFDRSRRTAVTLVRQWGASHSSATISIPCKNAITVPAVDKVGGMIRRDRVPSFRTVRSFILPFRIYGDCAAGAVHNNRT
jgi:hypothetical protein